MESIEKMMTVLNIKTKSTQYLKSNHIFIHLTGNECIKRVYISAFYQSPETIVSIQNAVLVHEK